MYAWGEALASFGVVSKSITSRWLLRCSSYIDNLLSQSHDLPLASAGKARRGALRLACVGYHSLP
jgi:hypothetical protein